MLLQVIAMCRQLLTSDEQDELGVLASPLRAGPSFGSSPVDSNRLDDELDDESEHASEVRATYTRIAASVLTVSVCGAQVTG